MTHSELVTGSLSALFCGALIGVEREMGKARFPREADVTAPGVAMRPPAGIRTHTLVALFGASLEILDDLSDLRATFAVAGLAVTAILCALIYGIRAVKTDHYGATSLFTLLLTYVLGVLSLTSERITAMAFAVAVTAVLAIKVPLHSFAARLTRVEIAAAVKFGLVALVLLPLLPDRTYGPDAWPPLGEALRALGVPRDLVAALSVVNPFRLWLLVVMISGIGLGGYVLVRSLGGRGLTLTGIVGGLVSSTAVSLSVAEQSRRTPELRSALVSAVLGACSVMAARVVLLTVTFAPALTGSILPPLGLMLGSGALLTWSFARPSPTGPEAPRDGDMAVRTPFALLPAIKLALLFLGVRLVAGVLSATLGGLGLLLTAAASGMVDVDAITAAVAQDFTEQSPPLTATLATATIFVAVAVNTLVKAGIVWFLGDRETGRRVALSLLATLAAGAAGLALPRLV